MNWIFLDPKHLWTQTFLGSNILLDSTSLWTQIILDPENSFQFEFFIDLFFSQIFSDPYFSLILKLLDPKGTIFFWLKLLWNKNFWDPKHLLTNYFWQNYHFNLICFYPISFSTQYYIGPNFFWYNSLDQKSIESKVFFYLKSLGKHIQGNIFCQSCSQHPTQKPVGMPWCPFSKSLLAISDFYWGLP